jgi:hypothetical protein
MNARTTIAGFLNGALRTTARAAVLVVLALLPAAAQTTPAQSPPGGAASAPAAPVQTVDGLDGILARTHAFAQKFAEDFSNLRYDEDIVEAKLKKNSDKAAYEEEILYDSMLRMQFEDGQLRVDEQRNIEKWPRHVESRPLLNTYGFCTLAMIFHPYYDSSFRFTRSGDDVLQGMPLAKIQFAHIPGTPTPVLYQMFGPDHPLEVSGSAWVDATTGEIYRIDATIAPAASDLGVKAIRASVEFKPILLQDETKPRVLPVVATIDLETPHQHWRNVHRFSDYRKFRVAMSMPGATQ